MKHIRQWTSEEPHSRELCSGELGTWCNTCGCCHHCKHDDCACPYCGCATSLPAEIITLITAEDET